MVHIASIAGLRGMDDPMDAYQVSKAGLISLSRALAVLLAPERIRSNTVCPGAIETPMLAGIYAEDPSRRQRMIDKTPLARIGRPEEVAATCLHLLSDEAGFVTGTDIVVDGGWRAISSARSPRSEDRRATSDPCGSSTTLIGSPSGVECWTPVEWNPRC